MELRLENLTKSFDGFKAVNDVTYNMEKGVYGLLGVNGAGKTTIMRMLCTLLKPTCGRILYNGEDIFAMQGEYRRILGYLPQEFGFYPDFTVRDYLKYIASIKGIGRGAASKLVGDTIKMVGLEKVQYRKMKKLSGGMKRRAGIAQSILNNPKILILDEPTAGLDPKERIRFRNLISELSRDRIILLSTHIVSDIEYIANEILLMKSGRIIHSGSTSEIAAQVDQRVWSLVVPQNQVGFYMQNYKIGNIRTVGGNAEIRILSRTCPDPSAREERLNLEDVFLNYFGRKEDEDNDII
ncbi:MAG: ABC transporter ATP-binding protein [Anaerovoracaceae bacterium]